MCKHGSRAFIAVAQTARKPKVHLIVAPTLSAWDDEVWSTGVEKE